MADTENAAEDGGASPAFVYGSLDDSAADVERRTEIEVSLAE